MPAPTGGQNKIRKRTKKKYARSKRYFWDLEVSVIHDPIKAKERTKHKKAERGKNKKFDQESAKKVNLL